MSRKNGKTFPNTIAARNNDTVSGSLWRLKEKFYEDHIQDIHLICRDIQDNRELSESTIRALASQIDHLVTLLDEGYKSMIGIVECEEENANLPQEEEHEQGKDV